MDFELEIIGECVAFFFRALTIKSVYSVNENLKYNW